MKSSLLSISLSLYYLANKQLGHPNIDIYKTESLLNQLCTFIHIVIKKIFLILNNFLLFFRIVRF